MKQTRRVASSPPDGVPCETAERLEAYVALLRRWNRRINLIAASDESVLWQRHVLDSLQLAPLLPAGDGPIADLGSGSGLPGMVLATATHRPVHLVEADRRKAAFLIEAARALHLPHVTVHAARAEALTLPPLAAVAARAFAALPILLGHAHRLLAADGVGIFPKGRTAEDELTAAARDWTMRVERFPSRTDPAATILRLSEIHPARAIA